MSCVFCKIINGEIPSYTIYEDDVVKVFLDINPDSNGHMLIIPKEHILDLDDINSNTLSHVMQTAKKMKKLLEERLNIDGLTLIQNNGKVQDVKHYHLHLKPYYKNSQTKKDPKDIFEILS